MRSVAPIFLNKQKTKRLLPIRTLNAKKDILHIKNSFKALNVSSRGLSIQSSCSMVTVTWKDPGLMGSHMGFV